MQKVFDFTRQKIDYVILLVPIFFYWIYWTLNPSYWYSSDPATWYFLDSLGLFIGKPYAYAVHPGTPMQVIGSFLLALTYPFFSSREAFIHYHITEPETFFVMTNVFLLVMNAFTAIVFYKTVCSALEHYKRPIALGLSLMFFAIHQYSFESLTFWSHNSINYPFGTLWLLWLYRELRNDQALGRRKLVFLGLAAGMLSMAQMYFLGWLAGGVVTIFVFSLKLGKTIRAALIDSLYLLAGGTAGIISMLVPVYREVPQFADWLWRILTNRGIYGTGGSGVYTLDMIPDSLSFWWATIPLLLLLTLATVAMFCVVVYFAKKLALRLSPGHVAIAVGLLFQLMMLFIVLSKLWPKLRYMLSIAALLPVLLLVALKLLEQTPWKKLFIGPVIGLVSLAAVVFVLVQSIQAEAKKAFVERDAALARSLVVTHFAQMKHIPEKDVVVVYGSNTPLKCAGLLVANDWLRTFDAEIGALCPSQYALYDMTADIDLMVTQPVPTLEQIDWDIAISPGNHTGLQDKLRSLGASNIPNSWGVERGAWFFINSRNSR